LFGIKSSPLQFLFYAFSKVDENHPKGMKECSELVVKSLMHTAHLLISTGAFVNLQFHKSTHRSVLQLITVKTSKVPENLSSYNNGFCSPNENHSKELISFYIFAE